MATKNTTFDEAMKQLEEVVRQLESGDAPLEQAIDLYKKGMELSAICQQKLQSAEKQLVTMIDEDGNEQQFSIEQTEKDDQS
ncbi:exodeoxyribonuclease VII small subunit [Paenisporosarcina cavernae]|uniref:Exodeoxyribonuclease 7 small subunit n=1 Tax=Paenisporosarcina cavernae TaxID=2320858 RepID=A0A385YT97_9BACL|nr:exodeoxyribonuclease VII small subunit [Paenisporosarcina cavernae]AYC29540.1 exodeoxyribonuclease VII small subunit [Paenisporosarcina cavernae]